MGGKMSASDERQKTQTKRTTMFTKDEMKYSCLQAQDPEG